jgi:dipeptidyl aminopeptidase/acylaminoacyl peptidase
MTFRPSIAAAAIAAVAGIPAQAADTAQLAQVFGLRESILDASISPSGQQIAIVTPDADSGEALYAIDLTTDGAVPRQLLSNNASGQHLRWCDWISETRLLCQIRAQAQGETELLGVTRLIAVDTSGKGIKVISDGTTTRSLGGTQFGGSIVAWHVDDTPGSVLITRNYVPELTTGTHGASSEEGLGVDRLDIESLRRRAVEHPNREAERYLADEHGEVRARINRRLDSGYLTDKIDVYYRLPGSSDWQKLKTGTGVPDDFWPVSVDSASNVAIGFGGRGGRQVLMSVSLDGSNTPKVLLANDRVDVDEAIRVGTARRVIGASFATDRREVDYFDPKMAKLAAGLAKALPGEPQISLLDESDDGKLILLSASSDTDPGMLYLYHDDQHRLEQLLPVRKGLAGMKMATMKPVTYRAADGTEIPAYLTLPPGSSGKGLKALVMPHGGPSARDEWGFDWLVQFFAQAGYAVLQPNFRGSSGYGENWYQDQGFKAWKTAIGDVNDAGRWLIQQGIASPDGLGIFGWSYGGYAALQSQVLDNKLFKAVVAVAPVTDLAMLRDEASGFTNAELVRGFIGDGPQVREGSPLQRVDAISAPVLLFHGSKDENVDVHESRAMADALQKAGKAVTYVEFDGLDHYLDSNKARTRMLEDSIAFLDKQLAH